MIKESLHQIIGRLNDYLNTQFSTSTEYVVLSHLSEGNESVHVNLVNVEEDKVFKNRRASVPQPNLQGQVNANGGEPIMRLNLYVLFAFNPGDSNLLYEKALLLLSVVLRYFHSNPSQEVQITNGGQQETYKLTVSYHNISLEDSNNMWSNLGGTQKPYAMYKMQLVEIVPTRNPALAPVLQNPVVMTGSTNQTMN